jgi:hypothetical protein
MIATALLLSALAAPADAAPTARDLTDVESATDAYAACVEPRLARDPLIRKPIGERIAFEQLDNPISTAAFQACRPVLATGERLVESFSAGAPDSKHGWSAWFGLRFLHQRYAFYLSRGKVGLPERVKMRPYFACVAEHLRGLSSVSTDPSAAADAAIAALGKACGSLRFRIAGDGDARRLDAVAQIYQATFVADAMRFAYGRSPVEGVEVQ